MSDKPKIDFSKLNEYSIPAPPIQRKSANNWPTFSQSTTSKKRQSNHANTILLGIIALLLFVIALPILFQMYVWTIRIGAISKPVTPTPSIIKTFTGPSVSLTNPTHGIDLDGRGDAYFVISGTLTNRALFVAQTVELHVRRSRKGRPLPDYQWNSVVEIKGGIAANETTQYTFGLSRNALNSRDDPILGDFELMEVSLDGRTWLKAPRLQKPDPFHTQLMKAEVPATDKAKPRP